MVKVINPNQLQTTSSVSTTSLSANNYDYVRAFAASRASDPIIIDELIQAYTLIAASLNISVAAFVQSVQNQGNSRDQDLYLAARLNTVRVRNALIGVVSPQTTPVFVGREITP